MATMSTRLSIILLSILSSFWIAAQSPLAGSFQSPPQTAKPRVWWHWMNGNITKEGIKKDLEWMDRIGIGGFQNFDANLFTPVIVPQKLVFMTPEWKEAFKYTTELAAQKNLEMAIAGSPGWSVTGGPWVEPKDGMKKYVWSETVIDNIVPQIIKLNSLPDVAGKIQNIPIADAGFSQYIGEKPIFTQDAKVIAFKMKDNDVPFSNLNPKATINAGDFNPMVMMDGNTTKLWQLKPEAVGKDMYVQYEFTSPQSFKAFTLVMEEPDQLAEFRGGPQNRRLKVSDDGINFKTIVQVSGTTLPHMTCAIPDVKAKYWRMCFETLASEPNAIAMMFGAPADTTPKGTNIAEFSLHTTSRIDAFEDKAGFTPWKETYESTSNASNVDALALEDVIDLTGSIQSDGSIDLSKNGLGKGRWKIIRMGYSLTGRQNHPASPEATGLEVDKLDKDAVIRYINTYLDKYKDATGGLLGEKGLQYVILDSYEAGHMNWTQKMPEEFKNRRGYDLTKWLPVLTGRVVVSVADSEKFLWDFRKTIGEMIAENHYDVIGQELHKRGMKRYTESHEGGRIFLADGMDVKKNADIPMSAMWTPGSLAEGSDEEVRSQADIREAASVANIYGQNIVAAESMTSIRNSFSWHPEKLKRTADMELASGLNRFIIHTSVHQPLDDKKPGFSLGPFGQYFTRHETWSEAGGKAWMDYLGKSSFMLQQGHNVADILYLYGENSNITLICTDRLPSIPQGLEFDFANAATLISAIDVKGGKLISNKNLQSHPYEILMLDPSTKFMTLSLLKRLKSLTDQGVKIYGSRPIKSPSLADDDRAFQMLADQIWRSKNVRGLDEVRLEADVQIENTANKILFRHRKTSSEDIYWLNNRSDKSTEALLGFRISDKTPELWHAVTGKIEKVSYQIKDGKTFIPLSFEPWDSYFIVFSSTAPLTSYTVQTPQESKINSITTPWQLTLGNKKLMQNKLTLWNESTDTEVKYFSGTGLYETTINLNNKGTQSTYMISIDKIYNIAEVIVNGQAMGTLWKAPYTIDITKALKNGSNTIQIKVTNTWVNRLIGDAQPGTTKTTFTALPFFRGMEPLIESGIGGEVKIIEWRQ